MNRYQFNRPTQYRSFFPPVIKWLLAINVLVFLLDKLILPGLVGVYHVPEYAEPITPLSFWGGLWPVDQPYFYPWQYVTTMFLHAGVFHLLINMFVLWMFGMEIANLWGTKRFLVFYFLCGLGASALHTAMTPFLGVGAMAVGASGAIAGVVVAYSLLFPDRLILLMFIPMRAKWVAPFYIGYSVLMGFNNDDNIAHFAHLGGALAGLLLVKTGLDIIIANKLPGKKVRKEFESEPTPRPSPFSRADQRQSANIIDARFREVPHQPPANAPVSMDFGENQEQIDTILDKISQHGYQSLTQEEKDLLMEASKSSKN